MHQVTFLGPYGATFSHDAYNALAEIYNAPKATEQNYTSAAVNNEVLPCVCAHGGYGAIAMETRAGARVIEPLESFIHLLDARGTTPHVVGAIGLRLHFCLVAREGVSLETIGKVVAHPKAYDACLGNITKLGSGFEPASSNGEAARLVLEHEGYKSCAALAPRSAAEKYGLSILNEAFEDREAVTTFFLLAPRSHQVITGKENRMLVVFKTLHEPGALVKALLPFAEAGLNLIHIHSVHVGNLKYDFLIEIEVHESELMRAERAMQEFEQCVEKCYVFGPFEVLSR